MSQDELSDDLLNLLIAQTGSDVHSGLVRIINTTLMWSACHKKRYLLCVELTNFGIFTKPFPIFFHNKQN